METSRKTSLLLQHRASHVVQPRLEEMEKAYLAKDFETFGRITMQDSNQFHAVCLDTYPPIFYMNDVSKSIIRLATALNAFMGKIVAAYTFDAGPNAVIYTLAEYEPLVTAAMMRFFPAPKNQYDAYCNNPVAMNGILAQTETLLSPELIAKLDACGRVPGDAGDVKVCYPITNEIMSITGSF